MHAGIEGMPEVRDCGADVLSLEGQARWNAAKRHEAAPAARRRERIAKEGERG